MSDRVASPERAEFDPDALRAKYREERDKRLRADGNDQYVEVKGTLAHFADDPYVEPGFTREPLRDASDVVVIGGGFGGLLAAVRLREAGVDSIRLIEKGGDFGGTWYWNRYPGAMCDVESYVYLPLLEELGYVPTEKYARAPEILRHSQAVGRAYDLYRGACFQTEVTEMRWDERSARWIVATNRGDRMEAHYVVMANGPLNRPKLPGIPGIDSFAGHSFHLRHAMDNDVRTVEVAEAAEAEWVETIIRLAVLAQQFLEECTPGYYNNEGKPAERSGQNGFYGGGSVEFFRILREWREAGELQGLELGR